MIASKLVPKEQQEWRLTRRTTLNLQLCGSNLVLHFAVRGYKVHKSFGNSKDYNKVQRKGEKKTGLIQNRIGTNHR